MREMIKNIKFISPPLLSWDAMAIGHYHRGLKLRKQKEEEALEAFALKYHWKTNFKGLLESNYDALVLTDANAVIKWVNDGFFIMTGYSKSFTIGKKPDFLQGEKTIPPSLKKIKKVIEVDSLFSSTVVNYRKNQETYLCTIEIFPLFTEDEKLSHLLAVEKEVPVTAAVSL